MKQIKLSMKKTYAAYLTIAWLAIPLCSTAHPFDSWSSGSGGTGDLGLELVLLIVFSPVLLGPLLSFLSWRSPSKVLNIIAWLTDFLALILTFKFQTGNLGTFCVGANALSYGLLISRYASTATSGRYVGLQLLGTVFYLVGFSRLVFCIGFLLHIFSFIGSGYPMLTYSIFYITHGLLLFNTIKKIKVLNPIKQGMIVVTTWSIIIGAGAYTLSLIYARAPIHVLPATLFRMPYPNIFTELLSWAIVGMLVFFIYQELETKKMKNGAGN